MHSHFQLSPKTAFRQLSGASGGVIELDNTHKPLDFNYVTEEREGRGGLPTLASFSQTVSAVPKAPKALPAPAPPSPATSAPSFVASSIASRPSAIASGYVSAPQPARQSSHRHAQQPASKTPTREKQTGDPLQLSSQPPPETTVAGVYSVKRSKPIPHLGDDIAMTWPCHATAAAPTGSLSPVSAPWTRCAISGADPGFEA